MNTEKIKEIKACFMDLEGDPENKEIVKAIIEKTKNLIYEDNDLAITKNLLDEFDKEDMFIGVQNNTENVPDQYNIYISYKDKFGIVIVSLTKAEILGE